jgi:hypothetical protein
MAASVGGASSGGAQGDGADVAGEGLAQPHPEDTSTAASFTRVAMATAQLVRAAGDAASHGIARGAQYATQACVPVCCATPCSARPSTLAGGVFLTGRL